MRRPGGHEPIWIEEDLVSAIHDRQLAEHGGGAGLRADVIDLAAHCTAGVVQNHPFIDGNKRTGFVIGILFLELNGYRFTASEEDAAQAVLRLAAGTTDENGFRDFLRANAERVAMPPAA